MSWVVVGLLVFAHGLQAWRTLYYRTGFRRACVALVDAKAKIEDAARMLEMAADLLKKMKANGDRMATFLRGNCSVCYGGKDSSVHKPGDSMSSSFGPPAHEFKSFADWYKEQS